MRRHLHCGISIHSLRMEGDKRIPHSTNGGFHFNPLPPHGGRLSLFSKHFTNVHISIHSLRMEGDSLIHAVGNESLISIHSLRMEGDIARFSGRFSIIPFQSTPSAWRETFTFPADVPGDEDFNPLPPHGGRPTRWSKRKVCRYFNPLPPHGGRPIQAARIRKSLPNFNPLPPHGGRLHAQNQTDRILHFNPLPPHGGRRPGNGLIRRDRTFQSTPSAWRETLKTEDVFDMPAHFNPLPPHGGRHYQCCMADLSKLFQSTPSAWRETSLFSKHFTNVHISIHSLRMEGDVSEQFGILRRNHFNPLPPHGGRRNGRNIFLTGGKFQSTPSAWRETSKFGKCIHGFDISIHSLRMEGDALCVFDD